MRDSQYPLKTAWRFVLLVYVSGAILVPLFFTPRLWIPHSWGTNLGAGLLTVTAWFGWLCISCCLAIAGAGWSVYSLVRGDPTTRSSGIAALLANLVAAAALGAYLLLLTS
jgi:hypothetical protein